MGRRKGESGREQISRDNALSVRVQQILDTKLPLIQYNQGYNNTLCQCHLVGHHISDYPRQKCGVLSDVQCQDVSLSCFFCHFFSAPRARKRDLSLQRRLRFNSRWIREGMSLLLPHPSLGTSPLFRGCWQNLSLRHPREYFMWKTLTGRKQDISVCLCLSRLLLPFCLLRVLSGFFAHLSVIK